MAHVSPNDSNTKAKSFVGRLQVRERFTWIHHEFLISEVRV
jgi:hypothetical protein